MTIYTPTNTPSRPPQNPSGGVQGAPDIVTRNLVTGYEWNQGNSLAHAMVDANWVALDTMAQSGQYWPLYTGLYLKNRGLDTEGGIFVDNPYNNGGVERFGVNYVNYRIPLEDSSFGITLAQGDFLSYKGNLHLKNGDIKYGTDVSFVDSALDSAMAITGTDIFVGKGSTANPNASQFRIGKLGGTQVEVGSLNNILNQEVTLQVGAAGTSVGTNASGSIKAKQTQVSPPLWNLTLNSYNGTTGVEALTIAPDGQVTIPSLVGAGPDYDSAKITDFTSPGLVNLGSVGGADTVVKGNLVIGGNIIGGGAAVGVSQANLVTTSTGLAVSQVNNTGAVTMNVEVAATYQMALATEVTSWNNLIGTAGGAAKADTLTTSRLIWGRPFNGSADVSGALTNVTSITSSGVPLELTSNDEIRLEANLAEYRFKSTSTPYGVLKFDTLTADRVYTMPNNGGTVALLSDLAASGVQVNVANTFTAMQTFSAGITGNLTGNADTTTTATDALALNGVTASITDNAKIVQRDASGNFTAGTITAALNGNADTTTTATDALALNGATASEATNGTIVLRDASGNFTAGTITAALNGNADTVTDGVTTNTVQTISAAKTFSSTVNISETLNFTGGVDAKIKQASAGQTLDFYVDDYGTNPMFVLGDVPLVGVVGFLDAPFVVTGTISCTGAMQINGAVNFSSGLSVQGAITASGDITAFYTSDKRLKDNITPIPNALDKVASLSGNTFDWNDKTDKVGSETGVIAQEVQALGLPDVVTERDNGYLAVRYEKLVPLLIEAIKELKAEVEELKA